MTPPRSSARRERNSYLSCKSATHRRLTITILNRWTTTCKRTFVLPSLKETMLSLRASSSSLPLLRSRNNRKVAHRWLNRSLLSRRSNLKVRDHMFNRDLDAMRPVSCRAAVTIRLCLSLSTRRARPTAEVLRELVEKDLDSEALDAIS